MIAFFASLLSLVKFSHCYFQNWVSPDNYIHNCYTDISALYGARDLIHHTFPYISSTNSVEYPPLVGLIMWLTSLITPSGSQSYRYYFLINVLFIAITFISAVQALRKFGYKYWYLFPLAPAVIASLYINWDIYAVISGIAAIYLFDRQIESGKLRASAIFLGISIATKFFPIVLLVPAILILIKRQEISRAVNYLVTSLGTWLLINLPFIIFTPGGWWRFFSLNANRGADFGSIWYGLNLLHAGALMSGGAKNFALVVLLLALMATGIFQYKSHEIHNLALWSLPFVFLFTALNKVYSPQYVLWLTPMAVMAISSKRDMRPFWIWQAAEGLYHVAIWEYLAGFTGAKFGLPNNLYGAISILRAIVSLYFVAEIMRLRRNSAPPFTERPNPQQIDFAAPTSSH